MPARRFFVSLLLALTLLYLAIPNILFLFGWVRAIIAIPLSILIIYGCLYVWNKSRTDPSFRYHIPYSKADLVKLLVSLLLLLGATELIGLHGHVQQSCDFDVRNPIYNLLITHNWPLFGAQGEYFVYYHGFWLPAAAVARLCPTLLSPETLIFAWAYLGIALSTCIVFTRLKGNVLLFTLFLLLLGNMVENLSGIYTLAEKGYLPFFNDELYSMLGYLGCGSKVRYFHFWGGLMYMFNHLIPSFLLLAVIIARFIPVRFYLFLATLLLIIAPFTSLTLFPFLVILLFTYKKTAIKEVFATPTNWLCLPTFLVVAAYLSCQHGHENTSSFIWIWEQNPYNKDLIHPFRKYAAVRIFRVFFVAAGILIPLFIILSKKLQHNLFFKYLLFLCFAIPICWVGRANNEIMYKGSVIIFVFMSLLLSSQYVLSSKYHKLCIILFVAFSAFHIPSDVQNRQLLQYSWSDEKIKSNIRNSWGGHLNHPQKYEYANFFGQNQYPTILYTLPGESLNLTAPYPTTQ